MPLPQPPPQLRSPAPIPSSDLGPAVSMTTRALQELDGGLGSSQAGEDLSTPAAPCPAQPQDDRARGNPGGRAGGCPGPVLLLTSQARTQRPTLHWLRLAPRCRALCPRGCLWASTRSPTHMGPGPHGSGFQSQLAGNALGAFGQGCGAWPSGAQRGGGGACSRLGGCLMTLRLPLFLQQRCPGWWTPAAGPT